VSEPILCEACQAVIAEAAGPGTVRIAGVEVFNRRGFHLRCPRCKAVVHRPRTGIPTSALDSNTSSRQDMSK
jgi:phage FluMu protein Com